MALFKTVIVSLGWLSLVASRPQAPSNFQQSPPNRPNGTVATIIKSEFQNNPDGSFRWEVETSDGFKAEQSGVTEPAGMAKSDLGGTDDESGSGGGEAVKGSYSYKAPNGQLISLSYVADKNGFQPVGSHLPTPPPNPFGNATAVGQH